MLQVMVDPRENGNLGSGHDVDGARYPLLPVPGIVRTAVNEVSLTERTS